MTSEQKYILLIRMYLHDNPEMNRLLRDYESSDDSIRLAIRMVLSDWTATDPYHRQYTTDNFPCMDLLIKGVCVELLTSAGIYHSRNRLSYSAGGLSVEVHNKGPEYMDWINQLKTDYENKKMRYLRIINANSAWGGGAGGLHSDYVFASIGPSFNVYEGLI